MAWGLSVSFIQNDEHFCECHGKATFLGVAHFIRVAGNKQRSLSLDFRGRILALYIKDLGPRGPKTFVFKGFWYLVNPIFGRQKTLIYKGFGALEPENLCFLMVLGPRVPKRFIYKCFLRPGGSRAAKTFIYQCFLHLRGQNH